VDGADKRTGIVALIIVHNISDGSVAAVHLVDSVHHRVGVIEITIVVVDTI
jgi:hypothetical protein